MLAALAIAALSAFPGCVVPVVLEGERLGEGGGAADPATADTAPAGDTGAGGDTSPGGDTGPGEDTAPDVDTEETGLTSFDCAELPDVTGEITTIPNARAYHGILLDEEGYLYGSDNSSIIRADYEGIWSVAFPGQHYLHQMAWLPDGDMVVSSVSTGALKRISADGGSTTLSSDVNAYGVIVGPDDMIYAANNSGIYRIDPESGEKEIWLPGGVIPGGARVLAFNLDYTILYVGTLSGGKLYQIPLDGSLEPADAPALLAGGMGASYHDALVVDVCGNLYLTVYSDSAMYRISPAGEVLKLWDPELTQHGHAMAWGSGIGGFRQDAVYIGQPYNNNAVREVVIGVPGRDWEGEVLNGPAR